MPPPPYKLSVFLANDHSFLRLENKERNVDFAAGLYPVVKSDELKTNSASRTDGSLSVSVLLSEILVTTLSGIVADDFKSYQSQGGFGTIPKVTFPLSRKEAVEVEDFIMNYANACEEKDPSCIYQALTFNCVDFAQATFSKTSYPGSL